MHALYIGKNKNWHEHLNVLLKQNILDTETPFEARSYIFENWFNSPDPCFIFLEYVNPEKNSKYLDQLKKNRFTNQYLILVGENISHQQCVDYNKRGIDEIISPDINENNLLHLLYILPRLHPQAAKEQTIQTFHLPLWKRTFDVFFSGCALIGLSPLLLITALAIRLESAGPIIYTSKRVGSNYRIFGFLKFRSMYKDADQRLKEYKALNQYQEEPREDRIAVPSSTPENDSVIFIADDFHLTETEYLARRKKLKENNFIKLQNDPRITRIGKIIRKYSIDELPQLINILKGDMSIVGNRPLPLYEAEMLTSDEYVERFMAPSGLTGLWQVEKRGTEGILSPEERKQLDIQYARKFSFWLDMKIILRTFTAFIQKENV